FTSEDKDGDGYPSTEDCNDNDPEVNPGMPEIPGNGIDDDCNPATPDTIPQAALSCQLLANRASYTAIQIASLEGSVENHHGSFSLTGLSAALKIRDSGGTGVFDETRQLAPLPPGGRAQQNFVFAAAGRAPGSYQAELTVTSAGSALAQCTAGFTIESSAGSGAGLGGDLVLTPALVNAGDPSNASYTVRNQGNATLTDLAIRVLLLDPETGAVVGELNDTATLAPGGSFSATKPFSTVGLATNKSYLAVLLARPAGSDAEQTLDSASLTVVNAPPDCSRAAATPLQLWPPNHKYLQVTAGGVTDPDGDPVTVTVIGVMQDERTDELGSGDTCPDATGVGTASAKLRAERSGRQDGRVYHVFFKATDSRGGQCQGEVKVCVPHDHGHGEACVDEGALYDSTL